LQHTFVGDCPADLYLDKEPDNGNVLIWVDREKGVIFDIWATFSGDEMIKMAESIEASPHDAVDFLYRPTWVPEDYEIVSEIHEAVGGDIIYRNGNEGMIVFSWSIGSESSVFGVNPEGVEVQNTFVGDCPADLYLGSVHIRASTTSAK